MIVGFAMLGFAALLLLIGVYLGTKVEDVPIFGSVFVLAGLFMGVAAFDRLDRADPLPPRPATEVKR